MNTENITEFPKAQLKHIQLPNGETATALVFNFNANTTPQLLAKSLEYFTTHHYQGTNYFVANFTESADMGQINMESHKLDSKLKVMLKQHNPTWQTIVVTSDSEPNLLVETFNRFFMWDKADISKYLKVVPSLEQAFETIVNNESVEV